MKPTPHVRISFRKIASIDVVQHRHYILDVAESQLSLVGILILVPPLGVHKGT